MIFSQGMFRYRMPLRLLHCAVLCLVTTALGCFGEKGQLTALHPSQEALGSVTVSPSAVILAVGDTRQLTFTASSLTGAPMTSFDQVQYLLGSPADSAIVRVGADGTVTALKAANLVRLNVVVKRDGVFKGDQVLLQVTQSVVPNATLSIQQSDSTRLAAGTVRTMQAALVDPATGASMPNPIVRYSVRPADVKRVALHRPTISVGGSVIVVQADNNPAPGANQIGAIAPEGTVWIHGSVDAYGTVLRDSVLFTLTYPFSTLIYVERIGTTITSPAANQVVTLAPGATATFQSYVNPNVDPQLTIAVAFDNPGAATAASPPSTTGGSTGNISPLSGFQPSNRRFMTPGTYRWTATAGGSPAAIAGQTLSGTLIIK
jgi:hypothetical protein